jgi:hypothetical protein
MTTLSSQGPSLSELDDLPLPSREQALEAGLRAVAHVLRPHEQVWIVSKSFDDHQIHWRYNLVRRGGMGRWLMQRYRFDGQAGVLYFLGERELGPNELDEARRIGEPFSVIEWQNRL